MSFKIRNHFCTFGPVLHKTKYGDQLGDVDGATCPIFNSRGFLMAHLSGRDLFYSSVYLNRKR